MINKFIFQDLLKAASEKINLKMTLEMVKQTFNDSSMFPTLDSENR